MNLSYDAILLNYRFIQHGHQTVVVGHVFDDKKGRFPDGATIRTSIVISLHAVQESSNVIAQTYNSRYLLDNTALDQVEMKE